MKKVLNIAHAGARSLAPENTLAAARKALEVGADMWELDVSVSRDGVLILFHDDSLLRTTDAREKFPDRSPWIVTTFTLKELKELDAGSWFVETDPSGEIAAEHVSQKDLESYRGERIPTLEEALLFTKERGFRANVELKLVPPPMDRFPLVRVALELIDRLGVKEHVVISSFQHHWLREVEREWPEIEVQALVGWPPDKPIDWSDYHFKTYNVPEWLSPEEVRYLIKRGLKVNVYVVNDEETMKQYIELGVAGIITDFPQRLRAILDVAEGQWGKKT